MKSIQLPGLINKVKLDHLTESRDYAIVLVEDHSVFVRCGTILGRAGHWMVGDERGQEQMLGPAKTRNQAVWLAINAFANRRGIQIHKCS